MCLSTEREEGEEEDDEEEEEEEEEGEERKQRHLPRSKNFREKGTKEYE